MFRTPPVPSRGTPMTGADSSPFGSRCAPPNWPLLDSTRPMPASVAHVRWQSGSSVRIASSALPYAQTAGSGTPVAVVTRFAQSVNEDGCSAVGCRIATGSAAVRLTGAAEPGCTRAGVTWSAGMSAVVRPGFGVDARVRNHTPTAPTSRTTTTIASLPTSPVRTLITERLSVGTPDQRPYDRVGYARLTTHLPTRSGHAVPALAPQPRDAPRGGAAPTEMFEHRVRTEVPGQVGGPEPGRPVVQRPLVQRAETGVPPGFRVA